MPGPTPRRTGERAEGEQRCPLPQTGTSACSHAVPHVSAQRGAVLGLGWDGAKGCWAGTE